MTKASANPYPSILIVEGSAPANPSSGDQKLFIDSATHHLSIVNSSGSVTDIQAASGGASHSYIGKNAVGGSAEGMTTGRVYLHKMTALATDGFITSIGAYLTSPSGDHPTTLVVAVYPDSGGHPHGLPLGYYGQTQLSIFMEQTTSTPLSAWMHVPLGVWVPAGTYWLAAMDYSANPATIAYDTGGADEYYAAGTGSGMAWLGYAGGSTWYPLNTTTRDYSIRADFIPTS